MAFFKRRSAPGRQPGSASHSVVAHLAFDGSDFGSPAERAAVFALEDRLIAAVDAAGVGEIDGYESGGGEGVLYAYGPDADALFAVMEPHLRAYAPRPSYAILRFGDADDPTAVERRIEL